jgi:hypothetical protein
MSRLGALPPLDEYSATKSSEQIGHKPLQSLTSVGIEPKTAKPKRRLQSFTSVAIGPRDGGEAQHSERKGTQRNPKGGKVTIRKWLTQQGVLRSSDTRSKSERTNDKSITLYLVLQKVLDGWTFLVLIIVVVTYVPWYVAFWPYINTEAAAAFRALEVVMDILFFLAAEINVDSHSDEQDDDDHWEPSPSEAPAMNENPMLESDRRRSSFAGRTTRTESMASRLHSYTITGTSGKIPEAESEGTVQGEAKMARVRVKYQDLIGAVPYQFLVLVPGDIRLKRCLGLLSLLKLMRLTHITRLKARNDQIKKRLDGLSMQAQVIRLISGLIVSAHVIGCIFFFIGDMETDPLSWVQQVGFPTSEECNGATTSETSFSISQNDCVGHMWLSTFFWSVATLLSCEPQLGVATIETTAEKVFLTMVLVYGSLFGAYFFGAMYHIMHLNRSAYNRYVEKRQDIKDLCRFYLPVGVNPDGSGEIDDDEEVLQLRSRVDRWIELKHKRNSMFDVDKTLQDMPSSLHQDLKQFMLQHMVRASPIFAKANAHLLRRLCMELQQQYVMSGEWLCYEGEVAKSMSFLNKGRLGVFKRIEGVNSGSEEEEQKEGEEEEEDSTEWNKYGKRVGMARPKQAASVRGGAVLQEAMHEMHRSTGAKDGTRVYFDHNR